jgi:hypothetical protein
MTCLIEPPAVTITYYWELEEDINLNDCKEDIEG